MEQVKKLSPFYLFYFLLIFFIINRLFFFSPGITEQTMSCMVYPFVKVRSMLAYPFSSLIYHWQSVTTLQQTIEQLRLEKEGLQEKIIQNESIYQFVEQSKEVAEFAQRYENGSKKLVKILLTVISPKEDIVIIDAGIHHGICKDDVMVYKNMLIGRVIELHPWYSKVALITDKRCKVSAQSKDGVVGICSGKNNGELEFNFVPHFKEVAVGDLIISTGNGLVYPQGFALGEIMSIRTDNVAHYIEAKTLLDLHDLSYVYIFNRVVPPVDPEPVIDNPVSAV